MRARVVFALLAASFGAGTATPALSVFVSGALVGVALVGRGRRVAPKR